jgi:hypothetical protein
MEDYYSKPPIVLYGATVCDTPIWVCHKPAEAAFARISAGAASARNAAEAAFACISAGAAGARNVINVSTQSSTFRQ